MAGCAAAFSRPLSWLVAERTTNSEPQNTFFSLFWPRIGEPTLRDDTALPWICGFRGSWVREAASRLPHLRHTSVFSLF